MTDKQRAAQTKYCNSEHGRAVRREYRQTPKGRAAARKWRESSKGREWMRKYHQSPKHKALDRKYKYGLTEAQWQQLLQQQNYQCAICKKEFTHTPCVDHDHNTSKIRGLLCQFCNRGIGCLRDNPSLLRSAALYLEK